MSQSKIVLITGCSSGIGRLVAHTLARKGHTVFASMRDTGGKNAEAAQAMRAWAAAEDAALHVVDLDVTSDASVDQAVQHVLATAGRIDVAVNNAASGTWGLLECYTPAQLQSVFDVNVFGVQRVNRAVLPAMRESRSGLLVHVSSVVGRVTLPVGAPYNATKWALEALAETYRYELSGVGVDSVIVQLGGYPTEFAGKMAAPADAERARGYGASAELAQRVMAGMLPMFEPTLPDPQEPADVIAELVDMTAGTRPLRTAVGHVVGVDASAINQATEEAVARSLQFMGMTDLLALRKP
jgi:NAD(P)-dependent dehydrogenase (short-subunit alcohol dehydrogenase family)